MGDTRFCHYLLEHGMRWALQRPGHTSFWDVPFFFPAPNVAAYSEVLLGAMPLYALWRALGFPEDTAFQLWLLSLTALNYLAMHALLRRGLGSSALPATFGALLFAAAGMRTNQTMHPQLFPQALTVLATLALVRIARPAAPAARSRRVWLAVFFVCLSWQLWAAFYLGWFLGLGLMALGAVALALPEARRALQEVLRAHPVFLTVGALLTLASLLPLALPYLEGSRELGMRHYDEVRGMIPRLKSWFHFGHHAWVYGPLAQLRTFRTLPMEHEQRLGLGVLTLALCVTGFVSLRRATLGKLALGVTLVLFFVSSKWGLLEPWYLVYSLVPGARAIRAVCRIALFVLVPLSIALAAGLEAVGRRWGLAAVLALGVALALEQGETTGAFDKLENRRDVAAIAARVPHDCQAFLYAPVLSPGPTWKEQIDGMWASLESGVPTLNGYSGGAPRGYPFPSTALASEADEARLAEALADWGQRHGLERVCVVRHTETDGPRDGEVLALEAPPELAPGEPFTARLRLRNTGTLPWRPEDVIEVATHASREDWRQVSERALLARLVAPGESVEVALPLAAPLAPGTQTLRWRMQWRSPEGTRGFGELSEPWRVRVRAP